MSTLALTVALVFPALQSPDRGPLARPGDLDELIAAVLPTPDEERFTAIEWQQSLMQARVVGAERERPLFLWIMNGHPFGCT
jgi:hypothetical protein